jgi:hypothetical protein
MESFVTLYISGIAGVGSVNGMSAMFSGGIQRYFAYFSHA